MVASTARTAVLGALLALAALLSSPTFAHAALDWGRCVDFRDVRCATLPVPLDRTGVDPGTVDLRIGRVGGPAKPTLMYLSGGPGGAGLSEMLSVVSTLPELKDRFQLIGYDQRGTGRSGLLRCPRLEKDPHLRDTAAGEDCANRIGPARTHYTTADSVQDMEAIRAQLGVEKVTLFGISYGTELAIQYARSYPQHVERLILDSVVDPDDADPFFTSTFRAMGPSLRSLCPGHCRGISDDPGADLGSLVAKLRARPLASRAYDARGRAHEVDITPLSLFDLMLGTDYLPPLRAVVPIAVRSALSGDGALLARMIRDSSALDDLGSPRDFSTARYATVCETDPLPWAPGTPVDQRPAAVQQAIAGVPANAFAPFDPPIVVEDEIDLCLRWPDVPHPPSAAAPLPYPTVPTLILQGGEDLRTPPEVSARIAARIPGSKRLVVPGTGHSTVSDPRTCSRKAIDRFIAGRPLPKSPCKRIPTGIPAVLGAPESITSLRGIGGLPTKIGRTVNAVRATFADLALLVSLQTSGGGLRGGSWRVSGNRLVLRSYEAVRGVTVSGTLGNTATLRIGGSKAAHGTLTLRSRGRITGTLSGRRISLRVGSASAAAARVARVAKLPR
jgi:pimeloyl-ACP methyl ester carboxylesterase